MNKKGFYTQIMIVIVMGVVLAGLMAFFYLAGIFGPVFVDLFGEVNTIVQDTATQTGDGNITRATQASFGNASQAVEQLQWISYLLMTVLIITFLTMCFFVRTYPFLVVVWILIIIVLVFAAIFMSNSYTDLVNLGFSDVYTSWGNNHFFMSYMPHIIAGIGIVGGIIMFILASRDQEAEVVPF